MFVQHYTCIALLFFDRDGFTKKILNWQEKKLVNMNTCVEKKKEK
jgi:hypothetical protein